MMYELPTALEVNGVDYSIRSDYRVVLDICTALSDSTMTQREKAIAVLLLYEDYDVIPFEDIEEAIKQALWFIGCGDEGSNKPVPKLMDWEQDFKWIVAPINRVVGTEVRSVEYMHWWTFIGYYYEIGDCMFAQIVSIRSKLAQHKKLDKQERDFYRKNRDLIDLKTTYSDAEKAIIAGLNKG